MSLTKLHTRKTYIWIVALSPPLFCGDIATEPGDFNSWPGANLSATSGLALGQ